MKLHRGRLIALFPNLDVVTLAYLSHQCFVNSSGHNSIFTVLSFGAPLYHEYKHFVQIFSFVIVVYAFKMATGWVNPRDQGEGQEDKSEHFL